MMMIIMDLIDKKFLYALNIGYIEVKLEENLLSGQIKLSFVSNQSKDHHHHHSFVFYLWICHKKTTTTTADFH